ncbi:MAG: protein-disulfide reductase DsbD family protein [Ferruginibacter sp.]
MMKKITLSLLVTLFVAGVAMAQIENPVKWSYTAKKISDKEYDIYITASIDAKWHLYAQDAGEGPEPTTISFTKNPLVTTVGKPKEVGKLIKEYDNNFNSVLKFYATQVSFVQRVKLKTNVATVVKGAVNFMVCNDRKCLPPKSIPFSVNVGGKSK